MIKAEVAVAVVIKGNDVLLLRRLQKEPGLDWCFPAGNVEKDESAQDAAIRETFEETGIVCQNVKQLGWKPHPAKPGTLISYWHCTYASGEPTNCEPDRHEEVAWVAIQDAIGLIGRDLTDFIQDFFKSLEVS